MPKKKSPATAKAATTRKPSPASAGEPAPLRFAGGAGATAEAALLTIGSVHPSPLNPRKLFDPAAIEALTSSIAAQGILQPLLVRPHKSRKGEFEIVAGERRYRAAKAAIAQKRVPADFKLPVLIRAVTDAELPTLAGTENVGRENLSPIEEATLFQAMRPLFKDRPGRAEAHIAAACGTNERTVFRRLALLRLAPELRTALAKETINLAQAQAFAIGPHNAQRTVLKSITKHGWDFDPDAIRRHITSDLLPVESAFFEPAAYKGEIVEDEGGGKFFADMEAAAKLQEAAIAAKLKDLKEKYPWAKRLTNEYHGNYAEVKPGTDKAGAILWTERDGKVRIQVNVLTPEESRAAARADLAKRTKRSKGKDAAPARMLTDGQSIALKRAKTHAIRRAVALDPKVALALSVMALFGDFKEIAVAFDDGHRTGEMFNEPSAQTRARELAKPLVDVIVASLDKRGREDHEHALAAETAEDGYSGAVMPHELYLEVTPELHAGALAALMAMARDDLAALHAALMARRIGAWFGFAEDREADTAFTIALAKTVDAARFLSETWKPDKKYFAAYGRDALFALALRNGIREKGGVPLNKLKKGEMVAHLAGQAPGFWTPDRFVETGFLSEAGMRKAFEDAGMSDPKPAKPKQPAKKASAAKAAIAGVPVPGFVNAPQCGTAAMPIEPASEKISRDLALEQGEEA